MCGAHFKNLIRLLIEVCFICFWDNRALHKIWDPAEIVYLVVYSSSTLLSFVRYSALNIRDSFYQIAFWIIIGTYLIICGRERERTWMNVILYIFRSILFRARIALGMRLLYISYKGMGRIVRLRNSSCIFGRDTQKLIEKKRKTS